MMSAIPSLLFLIAIEMFEIDIKPLWVALTILLIVLISAGTSVKIWNS